MLIETKVGTVTHLSEGMKIELKIELDMSKISYTTVDVIFKDAVEKLEDMIAIHLLYAEKAKLHEKPKNTMVEKPDNNKVNKQKNKKPTKEQPVIEKPVLEIEDEVHTIEINNQNEISLEDGIANLRKTAINLCNEDKSYIVTMKKLLNNFKIESFNDIKTIELYNSVNNEIQKILGKIND